MTIRSWIPLHREAFALVHPRFSGTCTSIGCSGVSSDRKISCYKERLRSGLVGIKKDDAVALFQSMVRSRPLPTAVRASRLESTRQQNTLVVVKEESPGFNCVDDNLTQEEVEAITRIPVKMSKRCQALMKQIICFKEGRFCDLLAAWVRRMKPIRADWLSLLKELNSLDSPFYIQVAEFSLLQDSFEANARDYTKIIHYYGKLNQIKNAEKTLAAMKNRGFLIDQVALTAMVQSYSKAGYHHLAEETFNDIKLLGEPLDYRSYGSMIMSYIRAGTPHKGEALLTEMDSLDICAGREVYKALLRAYSMCGDAQGAKRVFDAVQIAGITPDAKLCGLLINAYGVSGQSQNARLAFQNMRKAGIKADDKCVALVLSAYAKEEKLNEALGFLVELEKDSIIVGKEASSVLAQWFKKLGVVEQVELLLREFSSNQTL